MFRNLLLTTGIMMLGDPAFAAVINSATSGLAEPESTVTFSEHTFPDITQVSTEFADLGVTFLPHLFYRTASSWEDLHINGENLRSGDPVVNTFSIHFADALFSAAFVSIASPVTPATITARLDGVDVESFSTTIDLTSNSYYGFTDVVLNEIQISYTADTRLRVDNIQLGTSANLDPFRITDIDLTEGVDSNSVSLTWRSRPGRIYAVFVSGDMQTWIELDDGIGSEGDETSFTESAVPTDSVPRFYRVRDGTN